VVGPEKLHRINRRQPEDMRALFEQRHRNSAQIQAFNRRKADHFWAESTPTKSPHRPNHTEKTEADQDRNGNFSTSAWHCESFTIQSSGSLGFRSG
jgi:hypothetical protein